MLWMAGNDTAHVCVDPQNDFCSGGALEVKGGDEIMKLVNDITRHFECNILTRDSHPLRHSSFASSHPGRADYETIDMSYGPQRLWPDHCIEGTKGADFHPGLDREAFDLVICKGTQKAVDSYSAFFENDRRTRPAFENGQTFADKLRLLGIKTLVFSGLAFDYCVGWNALDAVQEGFGAIVVEDATRSIAPDTEAARRQQLLAAGVKIIRADQLQATLGLAGAQTKSLPILTI